MNTSVRFAADVGGTFTDVVLERARGDYASTKVLTTHDAPERAILEGVEQLAAAEGIDLSSQSSIVTQFVHGTTLATNALIERSGAQTALVTTEGFRDVIETRTESRFEQYDLDIVLPTPLIERKDRYTVAERRSASGNVLLDFDEAGAVALVEHFASSDYESVAVGFLHSYVDGTNERRFRDLLLDRLPDISVSISCEVSPQMREFERFNTVCANAYVQPLMASYLVRLRDELLQRGVSCPLYLVHSGGGLMSVESAAAFPVRLVESGPAGGAIFAADLAARYARDRVLSFDMGGTTAKISLIDDFRPATAKTFEVDRTARFKKGSGMPISIPVIDMIEIGAGGGSIASVDVLDQIRIGPKSAGSEPGPAAYSLGGQDATVTDANLQLGRLHPDTFGATSIDLSARFASEALIRSVGERLGLDANISAVGVAEVVDENMANAARAHAVENGKDMGGYTMIAFGGGAPLHAARLMDKLGLDELIVPPGAGVGSAIGFLVAPFSYEAVRSFYTSTVDFDVEGSNQVLASLTDEAMSFVQPALSEDAEATLTVERQVSMRYAGQGWEIPVALDADSSFDEFAAELLSAKFTKAYEEFFGRAIDDLAIETVSWSVRVSSIVLAGERVELSIASSSAVAPGAYRDAYDAASGERVETAVVNRNELSPGNRLHGPAIIAEEQTTTVLASHHVCTVQADGTLLITRARSTQ
ncbi:MAG: hydantoinase/oxoprolinase family protein [Ilumatobacter sp.]|jgi:N-methylhydantoinase A|uniref:hydantoinase/oxoprolinase family protein n=1 Tax=uncultured Ilumatobacter sp. TaxID=879968 RepID=UPI0035907B11|tara:strand:- start:1177 stop:3291 length:2115 start_codon:yes stop_codon:yes gene_type:complete